MFFNYFRNTVLQMILSSLLTYYRFVTRLTRRVLLVEQELLTLPVHPRFSVGFVLLDLQLYVYVL